MRNLFVTWDGPQVTYLESLFLPIFRGLQRHGIETDVLQFRWGSEAQAAAVSVACAEAGCRYRQVPILRRALAAGPFLTALGGARHIRRAIKDFGSDIIMPRSLMPALATLRAMPLKIPILFDSDGLAADEKVEFGSLSPTSPVYKALRLTERAMVRRASGTLVRTETAARILSNRTGVDLDQFRTVVNGRDQDLFTPRDESDRARVRQELGLYGDAPLLVYAGSVGPQYRFDLIVALITAVVERRPDARLLILSGQPEEARQLLGPALSRTASVRSLPPAEVPRYLAAADAGIAFRATSFSTRAVAPIKLGEYLLCGVPVIGTAAIGDTSPAATAGVFFDQSSGIQAAAAWIEETVLPDRARLRIEARRIGLRCFSLSRSVEDYEAALGHVSRTFAKQG